MKLQELSKFFNILLFLHGLHYAGGGDHMSNYFGNKIFRLRNGQAFRNKKSSLSSHSSKVMGKVIPFHKKEKTMESVFYVAAYILSKESMTHKKLQKLCFYAQSWYYAYTGNLLFDEPFEAWVHGPVCPILYKAYRSWGSLEIPRFERPETLDLQPLSKRIIDSVYEAYGKFSAEILEACTHIESPWKKARIGCEPRDYSRNIIDNEEMRKVCLDKLNMSRQTQA